MVSCEPGEKHAVRVTANPAGTLLPPPSPATLQPLFKNRKKGIAPTPAPRRQGAQLLTTRAADTSAKTGGGNKEGKYACD